MDLRPTGKPALSTRLDAQGRTLELAYYDAAGAITLRQSHGYQGPLEVRRVQEFEGRIDTTRWTYDDSGRELRKVERSTAPGLEPQERVTETQYGAHGRFAQRLHWHNGQSDGRSDFVYGAGGRLEREVRVDASGDALHETRFTYFASGRLQHVSYVPFATMGGETEDAYDEEGQLVMHQWCSFKGCFTDTYTYDEAGHRLRQLYQRGSENLEGFTAVLTRYDAAGKRTLEQLAEDVLTYADGMHHVRNETRRFLYACGSGALVREELDVDGDAVADGARELERDARGRLLRERFSGALQTSELAVREYRYACGPGGG